MELPSLDRLALGAMSVGGYDEDDGDEKVMLQALADINELSTEIEKAVSEEKQLIKDAKEKRDDASKGTEDQVKAANKEAENLEKEAYEKHQSIMKMKSRQQEIRNKFLVGGYRTIGEDEYHEVDESRRIVEIENRKRYLDNEIDERTKERTRLVAELETERYKCNAYKRIKSESASSSSAI